MPLLTVLIQDSFHLALTLLSAKTELDVLL